MPTYVYQMVKCPYCDETRKSTGLHKHIKTHGIEKWEDYQRNKPEPKVSKNNDVFKCTECDFSSPVRQSVTSHWWRNHTIEGKEFTAARTGSSYTDGRTAWNKGLTVETDARVKQLGRTISSTMEKQKENGTRTPRVMGLKAREELSERQSIHNTGGRCKWFSVNGISVQGTWEYNVALKLNEMNIKWIKSKTKQYSLKYIDNNKRKTYTPDFYLPEYNLFLEIKGYWWGNDKQKMKLVSEQHPGIKIVIVEKKEYEKLLGGELVW